MAEKKQSTAEILDLINMPGFESRPSENRAAPEVLAGMALRPGIHDVDFFADNPRRTRNPQYDEIKASIRIIGQRQPVLVSTNPATDRYTLVAGGNTRLEILLELYEETGDDKFSTLYCLYQPWTEDDEKHLLAHLIENELRGSMTFVDSAAARMKLQALWESEEDCHLSDRSVADRLRTHGLSAHGQHIGVMRYAVESLLPHIPLALSAGMGRPTVVRLRRIETAVINTLSRNDIDQDGWVKNQTWENLLSKVDEPGLTIDTVVLEVEDKLVEYVEEQIDDQEIGLLWVLRDFQAYLNGEEGDLPPPSWRTDGLIYPEDEDEPGAEGSEHSSPVTVSTPSPSEGLGTDTADDEPSLFGVHGASGDDTDGDEVPSALFGRQPDVSPGGHEGSSPSGARAAINTHPLPDADMYRAQITNLANSLATMLGSGWRDVGSIMADPDLDDDTAGTITELGQAFTAYRSTIHGIEK